MEVKTLEVELVDGEDGYPEFFYVRGHVDKKEFAKIINRHYDIEVNGGALRHVYLRVSMDRRVQSGTRIVKYDAPGRGRFKATIYEEGD